MTDTRRVAFVALAVVCVVAAGAAVAVAVRDRARLPSAQARDTPQARQADPDARARPLVVFLSHDRSRPQDNGRVTTAELTAPGATQRLGPLVCERVSWAGERGICLDNLGTTTDIEVLGPGWRIERQIRQTGVPSRTRISPDGRLGATTLFVVGHAYAAPGTFSTATTLFDLAGGRTIGNLESFKAYVDGRRIQAPDINYWGVTFARDDRTFYATLATGDHHYLVRGDIPNRTVTALHDDVECPALSPDGAKIAYKKTVHTAEGTHWRFTVLDLRTMRETPLAERDSVDDQLSWLDDHTVLYAKGNDVMAVPADGSGRPSVYLHGAESPVVVG